MDNNIWHTKHVCITLEEFLIACFLTLSNKSVNSKERKKTGFQSWNYLYIFPPVLKSNSNYIANQTTFLWLYENKEKTLKRHLLAQTSTKCGFQIKEDFKTRNIKEDVLEGGRRKQRYHSSKNQILLYIYIYIHIYICVCPCKFIISSESDIFSQ